MGNQTLIRETKVEKEKDFIRGINHGQAPKPLQFGSGARRVIPIIVGGLRRRKEEGRGDYRSLAGRRRRKKMEGGEAEIWDLFGGWLMEEGHGWPEKTKVEEGGGSLSMVALGSSEIGEEEGAVLFVFRPTVAEINGGNSDMAAWSSLEKEAAAVWWWWWCSGEGKREVVVRRKREEKKEGEKKGERRLSGGRWFHQICEGEGGDSLEGEGGKNEK
ncbi:hypothetical protein HAX54_039111 [Datura stramonium]|uniref:Uncharacterized protein n=1 Tax=Datura stramonium TaxID=4076 RepID=A0ABS8VPT0_DATST|nr:hypothetical protein [Datura stramonium]